MHRSHCTNKLIEIRHKVRDFLNEVVDKEFLLLMH